MFLDFRGGEFESQRIVKFACGDCSSNCRVRGKTAFGNVRKFDQCCTRFTLEITGKNRGEEGISPVTTDCPENWKLETRNHEKYQKRPNNSGL